MQYIVAAVQLLAFATGTFFIVIGINKLKEANRIKERERISLNQPVKIIQERRGVEELKAHYSIPSDYIVDNNLDANLISWFIKDLSPEIIKYVRVKSEDNPVGRTKEIEISLLVVDANLK